MAFSGDHPVCFLQGRRGEVYAYQGYGQRGKVWSPSLDEWRDVGVETPFQPEGLIEAPSITVSSTVKYYIARIDIEDPGSGYNKAPTVAITPAAGNTPTSAASAISLIGQGYARAIEVQKYGKGYTEAPTVSLNSPALNPVVGSGLTATVNLKSGTPAGTASTGIVYWEVVSRPPESALWPVNDTWPQLCTAQSSAMSQVTEDGVTVWVATATGGTGSGAQVRVEALGIQASGATGSPCCIGNPAGSLSSPNMVSSHHFGSGYAQTDEVTVTIAFIKKGGSCGNADHHICPMIIKGYPLGHPKTPKTAAGLAAANVAKSRGISSFTITGGNRYLRAPVAAFLPYAGGPASNVIEVQTTVNSSGAVTAMDPDGELADQQFLVPPVFHKVTSGGGGAKANVVMRPHLRGKYQCYYRYVRDGVPESEGGPLYSSLSEVMEVDCGDGAEFITWGYIDPELADLDGLSVELWRSTSNQANTLFRVAKIGGDGAFGSVTDSLTDWELIDPDRQGFLAMPILLPNGELNANRFGMPPTEFAVAVMFQDRLWMGVDTQGGQPNVLRYSETDEPESMPDVNELVLQTNLRDTDYITALIPYAGALIVAQSRHIHRLTYVGQPLIDAAIYLMAYRGVLNQRCWDIYEGKIYAMDDQGVYSMDPQGNVENLTLGIYDYWRDKIDFSLAKWFSVRADKRLAVLRVNIACKNDGSEKYPTRQLVYSFDYKCWWEERYPAELTSATEVRTVDNQVRLVYGTGHGKLRQLGVGSEDLAHGAIASIEITNPGRGYKQPPTITAAGGHGAEFECGLNSDGSITAIVIKTPGTGYEDGSLTISAPPSGGVQAVADYAVTVEEESGDDPALPVYWSFKSGCFEYTSDSQDRRGGEQQSRQCSVVYQPTADDCTLNLKTYYNNAQYPRSNAVRRDRGAGFVHSDEVPAAVLNMKASPLEGAEASGVARAIFQGRVLDDMLGTDRHVSVALSGTQTEDAGRVVIHSLDVYGTNDKQGG
jgi:hypothetical protein